MKKVILASFLALSIGASLAAPAFSMSAYRAYKNFQPWYWGTNIVCFSIAGPFIIPVAYVQGKQERLKMHMEMEQKYGLKEPKKSLFHLPKFFHKKKAVAGKKGFIFTDYTRTH